MLEINTSKAIHLNFRGFGWKIRGLWTNEIVSQEHKNKPINKHIRNQIPRIGHTRSSLNGGSGTAHDPTPALKYSTVHITHLEYLPEEFWKFITFIYCIQKLYSLVQKNRLAINYKNIQKSNKTNNNEYV